MKEANPKRKWLLFLTAALTAACGSCIVTAAEAESGKPAVREPKVSTAATKTSLTEEEKLFIRIYKASNRGVVNISTVSSAEEMMTNAVPADGFGSGFIIGTEGYILTNHHVVRGSDHLLVTLYDGSTVQASLVGYDSQTDLAVLRIKPPKGITLTPIPLGDSSSLEVGRRVLAIGNPFGFDRTLTEGIVSSIGRTIKSENGRLIKGIIQTDAAINPGNSGGPLLDLSGRVVGINTAIFSGTRQSAGIGFAIPINIAKNIIPQLIEFHRVLRPDMGVDVIAEEGGGLRVMRLTRGGPAAAAGLQGPRVLVYRYGELEWRQIERGFADLIVAVDNVQVNSVDSLMSYIESKKPNQVVTLTVIRANRPLKIPVKLTVGASD
ncbi:MAG: trypsin-like peptidase domain-containing protein [Candidatus Obscuribacter sp.]|nr:trypsin-like peptidase domain-containing protein [Candidatus Melainabacteria bacterium]MDX1989373.1 trypsin-like peptidase domain-containing protein [Candidatus Obscuribacter sp.]